MLGAIVAYVIARRRYEARGGNGEIILDGALVSMLVGIICARIFAVVTYPQIYFGPGRNPWKVFAIWEGGLAIYGGIIGGFLGLLIVSRWHKVALGPVLDSLMPGLLIAQGIGRLGNWFNQEVFGTKTTLPWGLRVDDAHLLPGDPSGTLYHPTFLYELIWNFLGAAFLIWWEKRFDLKAWQLGAMYLMVYSAGRGMIEMIRTDYSLYFLGVRFHVWFAILIFLLGAVIYVTAAKRSYPSRVTSVVESDDSSIES